MTLIKIDFQKIPWEREATLYRGTHQGRFELSALKSIVEVMKPSYWAYEDNREGKITFCEQRYCDSLTHAINRAEGTADSFRVYPFTHFPMVIEIKARKYRNRLYVSTEGEGIIIKGPISLEDITILFSSHINILEDRMSYPIRPFINSLESICNQGNFSRDDLLNEFERNEKVVLGQLYIAAYGRQLTNYTSQQKKAIRKFLNVLRRKLR